MTKYNYGGIEGLTLIRPTVFSDHRGCNFELYDSLKFKDGTGNVFHDIILFKKSKDTYSGEIKKGT